MPTGHRTDRPGTAVPQWAYQRMPNSSRAASQTFRSELVRPAPCAVEPPPEPNRHTTLPLPTGQLLDELPRDTEVALTRVELAGGAEMRRPWVGLSPPHRPRRLGRRERLQAKDAVLTLGGGVGVVGGFWPGALLVF